MKIFNVVLTTLVIVAMLSQLSPSFGDSIVLPHGDHIEMTCENDGTLSVVHTILETASATKNVTTSATYSFAGTLIGNITFENNSDIINPNITYETENGSTSIFANFTATLTPQKFIEFTMLYKINGLIDNENGTLHFRTTINTAPTAPPEIVVKIPKPSIFQKLVVYNTVPAPQVFVDEGGYYDLIYKSPLFTFENASTTLIDIKYETVWDIAAIFSWIVLAVASTVIGVFIGVVFDLGRRIRERLNLNQEWRQMTFEMYRDKEAKFRFRLKATNGETIATSESFKTAQGCKKAIESIKHYVANGKFLDKT